MASTVAASPAIGSSVQSLPVAGGSVTASKPSTAFFGTSLKKSPVTHSSSTKPFVVNAKIEDETKQTGKDRWAGLAYDTSDDQQDITRGKGMVDSLFQGAVGAGTQDPVLSSWEYLSQGQRFLNYDNMKDGYYIAPAFMDKLVVHIAKNFMNLPNIKVPLILGIWGGKGQGKSFQCELVLSKLGINPITMSAGELESGNAGEPAKLIRQRYREAADIIRKKGKMCVLFINDLDAGAGRMGGTTQYTVNNQMVNATLMNIADNPTNVQLPGVYNNEEIPRVPIIVTGNDFSTLYAPLIRDGRMEKFYWAPTREDRIGVCKGIFQADNVHDDDVVKLVDAFPGQSIDFFGALRARVYDDEVRKWIAEIGVENMGKKLVNSRDGPPTFQKPVMSVQKLLEYGKMLVQEQENVKRVQLADKYLKEAALGDANEDAIKGGTFYGDGSPAESAKEEPEPVAKAEEVVVEETKEEEITIEETKKEEEVKPVAQAEETIVEEPKKEELIVEERKEEVKPVAEAEETIVEETKEEVIVEEAKKVEEAKPVAQAEETIVEETKKEVAVEEPKKEEEAEPVAQVEETIVEETKKEEVVAVEEPKKEKEAELVAQAEETIVEETKEEVIVEEPRKEEVKAVETKVEEDNTNGAAAEEEAKKEEEKAVAVAVPSNDSKDESEADKKAEKGKELSRAVVTDALRGLVSSIVSVFKR